MLARTQTEWTQQGWRVIPRRILPEPNKCHKVSAGQTATWLVATDEAPPAATLRMQSHTMIMTKDEGTRGNRRNPRHSDNVWDKMTKGTQEEQGATEKKKHIFNSKHGSGRLTRRSRPLEQLDLSKEGRAQK